MQRENLSSELLVAPFTGAWIEIFVATKYGLVAKVAPFTGAWIEIYTVCILSERRMSLPSRGRGLKSDADVIES